MIVLVMVLNSRLVLLLVMVFSLRNGSPNAKRRRRGFKFWSRPARAPRASTWTGPAPQ
jgi:hypothetical protein